LFKASWTEGLKKEYPTVAQVPAAKVLRRADICNRTITVGVVKSKTASAAAEEVAVADGSDAKNCSLEEESIKGPTDE